ncbi:MAG: ABC transporter ATP-binding protein/permease [Clostridia bacterium]|nr:ABC transporter ATP-binding protein/permease [Clostridia bacterium]
MLELNKIRKSYKTADFTQVALDDITLEFRKSEFVSILGPSGSGKTTLLNIVGGLDRYDSGDLIINGRSTKDYKDKDWDEYRNNSIGFIFQSYNLIGHISVLSNVEMSMTLSGVGKKEKRQRALEVLERVGLKEHAHKKPNELSGGQMQRVAIARAIVNNPDIILADEPTGALDTATSVQIMELIKEISKDKLVIMVTHNPELAEKYSSRIIKLLDSKVIDDTNPYKATKEEKNQAIKDSKKSRKTSMSFLTALSLSINNLRTKKGRTILTAFAGSIGIIGIAAIMSLSNGVQSYIDRTQEETLSSYPLTIQEQTIDASAMIEVMMGQANIDTSTQEEGKVYSNNVMTDVMSTMSSKIEENNLEKFKQHIDSNKETLNQYLTAVGYGYDLNLNIYSQLGENTVRANPSPVFEKLGMSTMTSGGNASMMSMFTSSDVFIKLIDNQEHLESKYNVIAGKWPEAYNEVVLLVDKNNQVSDYTLYSIGLKSQDELEEKYETILKGEAIEADEVSSYTYDELLNIEFKILPQTDYYEKEGNIWVDKSEDEEYIDKKLETAETLKIVGIIKADEEAVNEQTAGVIAYTKDLEEHMIEKINEAEIVKEQLANEKVNVFTGLEFNEEETSKTFDISSLTQDQQMYLMSLSQQELANVMAAYAENANATFESTLDKMGYVKLEQPSSISIFPKDFEAKDKIITFIDEYNEQMRAEGNEADTINYTDAVGVMMSSVTSIVNMISYVLIAFVSISLIVSSIMIGIITYISVLERTKEIGILRSIGASKKDISRVFNAETLIIGFFAGTLGIVCTYLITIPANAILKVVTNISNLVQVPLKPALILVVISMILTVISGLIPAKMASKKDPVIALRTE